MQPKPAQDPFDLDFEADDEFAKPPEADEAATDGSTVAAASVHYSHTG